MKIFPAYGTVSFLMMQLGFYLIPHRAWSSAWAFLPCAERRTSESLFRCSLCPGNGVLLHTYTYSMFKTCMHSTPSTFVCPQQPRGWAEGGEALGGEMAAASRQAHRTRCIGCVVCSAAQHTSYGSSV